MALQFRNLTVSPQDPVDVWGFEGLLAAVDRGDLSAWRRIAEEVRHDPWGPVAQQLCEVFEIASDLGVVSALRRTVADVRHARERQERAEVGAQVRRYVALSALNQQDFARRIGTSPSRLSTYTRGSVTPSAALMVRMRNLAQRLRPS